jgi:hypothetical protein
VLRLHVLCTLLWLCKTGNATQAQMYQPQTTPTLLLVPFIVLAKFMMQR